MKAELKRDAIVEMLEELGRAVTSGDLAGVSKNYVYPAVMLMDGNAVVFNGPIELDAMFAKGREWYISQGIVEARSELENVEQLTEQMAAVTVRWPGFDAEGNENYSERSYYIIQNVEDKPRIRVAMTRTK